MAEKLRFNRLMSNLAHFHDSGDKGKVGVVAEGGGVLSSLFCLRRVWK
jgi:hypothetical protein